MMDRLSIKAAEQATGAGYRLDAGAALLIELDGPREECSARFEHVMSCASARARGTCGSRSRRAGARPDLADAQGGVRGDGPDRARLLRPGRGDPAHAPVRGAPPDRRARRRSTSCRWRTCSMPATATCIRSSASTRPRPGEAERAEELAGLIIRTCVDAGGSITGEHGVGIDKKAYMPAMFSERRPRRVPPAALRVRPARAGEPGQGDADAAAVRRGPRPLPRAPARARGHRGADVSDRMARPRQPSTRPRRALARAAANGRTVRVRGGGTKLGWGVPAPDAGRRAAHCRAASRSLEHNDGDLTAVLRGRGAAGRRHRRRSRPPGRCSRSTRRSACAPSTPRRSAVCSRPATAARSATATARPGTSCSGSRSRSATGRSRGPAGR